MKTVYFSATLFRIVCIKHQFADAFQLQNKRRLSRAASSLHKPVSSSVSSSPDGGGRKPVGALHHFPALVLNGDYTPLSYTPLSIWSWQDAIKAVFMGRVSVVAAYDDAVVRSPNCEMQVPSVIVLKSYVRHGEKPAFTRKNVFIRDEFTCQYCGERAGKSKQLTYDHVHPKSKGGGTSWTNVVACCGPCNSRKGDLGLKEAQKILKMRIRRLPKEPSYYELRSKARDCFLAPIDAEPPSHKQDGSSRASALGAAAGTQGRQGRCLHPTWEDFLG
mmetsp:Transcript_63259/g.126988  ORF Transcript_63259/g.126988 Transcript_63259/m.126988 type:complete len:275 (-) Transcript_63259:190-1014(-)|eukprot:CAMPEP_0171690394 /NCGR_PEP_ID=MMETSP0991-20121206/4975_1 /TAXON_ID=483369 /ORGANISM="non described non described, Strain CCMP2098" /LENGTH=274 /DNA_ID=CAMNT_0012278539 /DNA_START=342 /DNA_END=1166 /DNA_ORIENTATION=+